jgi:uncharacterized protein YeaO (DUF488 family)
MDIQIKRAYDDPDPSDGYRVLVDRIWPRGRSKEALRIDQWARDLAPSNELRKWFGHDPQKWDEFRRRYFQELDGRKDDLSSLYKQAAAGRLTLVYGARDEQHSNAAALRQYLLDHLPAQSA